MVHLQLFLPRYDMTIFQCIECSNSMVRSGPVPQWSVCTPPPPPPLLPGGVVVMHGLIDLELDV